MDILANLATGFATALSPLNLLYCFLGVLLGTLVGVLPGLGPVATIAMLLPATFTLPPESALIMLAGIYYGAQYGGSTTAILINLPGESSSVVTALDGYRMAQQGRAGAALATAAIGSFFAGTVATFVIAFLAPPLAALALQFQSPEYFSLMVLGLVASIVLAQGSLIKALGMMVLGPAVRAGRHRRHLRHARFAFGVPELADGINFVVVAMGVFGVAEIVRNLENERHAPGLRRAHRRADADARGLEAHGGADSARHGAGLAARHPAGRRRAAGLVCRLFAGEEGIQHGAEFGKGAIEGVAAPESANNAGAQTSFIPMLTLGIPSNPVMALMIGAMIIQGIRPGPNVMVEQPRLFWGVIASMWVGNLFLLVLNLPLIGLWVRLLSIPYHLLYPIILVFSAVGVLSLSNAPFDVHLMAVFGVLGYVFAKLDCEPAPLLLGYILGPMMEEYLRRAMTLSRGDPMIFLERPISAAMLALAVLAMVAVVLPAVRSTRDKAFAE